MTNIVNGQGLPPDAHIPPTWDHPELTRRILAGDQRVDWGLEKYGLAEVQKEVGGEGILVGVCDTGWPQGGHPDLPEPKHLSDFTRSGNYDTGTGHGTHCAGIIGARDNNIGSLGVAPRCDLASLRCLDNRGSGSSQGIADAIYKGLEIGCHVLSLSLGGGHYGPMQEACEEAARQGVFVVVAAGNSGQGGTDYPSKYASTFSVASSNSRGDISNFSSRGVDVDIAAPGEQIFSTWLRNGYKTMSGTSMATPFVAGLIALMLSARRDFTKVVRNARELRGEIAGTWVDDWGTPGHDRDSGYGIINPAAFVKVFRGEADSGAHI